MSIGSKMAALVMTITLGSTVGEASQSRPAVTIRVLNSGVADAQTMSLARRVAVRIFDHSGINLVWFDCDIRDEGWTTEETCGRQRGAAEFWLRITLKRPPATKVGALAFTELDDRTGDGAAGVYYPAVVEMAKKWRNREGDVLGAAIAHEVGHLILGANAHAGFGVMRARWSRSQFELIALGELNFARMQSRALQDQIAVLSRNGGR